MIAFVQQNSTNLATSTTPNLAFSSSVGAGNLLLAQVSWTATAATISSVQDTFVNSYSPIVSLQTATRLIALYAAITASGGANTVQFNISVTEAVVIWLYEFSGALITTDGTATTNGSTAATAISCGPITPTQNGDLLISFMRGGAVSLGETGWTLNNFSGAGCASEFLIQGSAAAASATYTQSNGMYAIVLAAFRAIATPAGGGGGVAESLIGPGSFWGGGHN